MTTTSIEVNQSTASNSLLLPVPSELVLLTVFPTLADKPTPDQIVELAAASEQKKQAYGIEQATLNLAVFCGAKREINEINPKPALLILENEEAVEDAHELGIAAIAIPASLKNSVPLIQKAAAELRDDKLGCLVYLGTGRTENIKQACANAGLPFIALHPLKFFSPLPEKPTIGDLFDRMNPSQFIEKVENLLKDAALGIEAPLSLEEAGEEARKILLCHEMTELQKNIELDKIRRSLGMTISEWKEIILNPVKDEVRLERLNLELLALLQTENKIEFITQKVKLCSKFQMSSYLLDQAIAAMKQRTSTPEAEVIDLETFLNKSFNGLKWTIPELLPSGETALLVANPKTGKSLLAVDAVFAVATGESDFLGIPVKQGRALLISVDESPSSTQQKLLNRGFKADDENLHVMTSFDVSQMAKLEAELEAFRPTLVVVDCLKRITHGREISENSAEFSDIVYDLKELFTKYGASGILIHHTNKNAEAVGVNRVRGSSAIAGATWGIWDLQHILKPSPSDKKKFVIDPGDPKRLLTIHSRDVEGQRMSIEFNPENNSWVRVDDGGVEQAERQKWQNRILKSLTKNSKGLTSKEIIELMGVGKDDWQTVYTTLSRMSNRKLIDNKPAPGKSRARIYSLPKLSQPPESDTANNTSQNPFTPPPPTQNYPFVNSNSESIDMNEFEVTKQVTKPPLNNDLTSFDEITYVKSSNPIVEGDSGVTKPIDTNRGGEGKNDVVELNQSTAQLSQPPSSSRENEVANCGAGNSFTKVDVYESNNSKSDKEQQTTGLTSQPRQLDIASLVAPTTAPQAARTAPQDKEQPEVSDADIEAMAHDIINAENGIMIMVVMATFYSQFPGIKNRVEESIKATSSEDWRRIEGLKEAAQDKVKPGAKCKIHTVVGRSFEWVEARLISAGQDAHGPVWSFELNDGKHKDIYRKEDWLLAQPDDVVAEIAEFAENAEVAEGLEIAEINSPVDKAAECAQNAEGVETAERAEFAEIDSPWEES
ncbi:AAA family ATPase [Cyanobacteria bacterium FACHB-472]|nr:AAA family ATPase [Cyanobacteria bacterium FACHB-472]